MGGGERVGDSNRGSMQSAVNNSVTAEEKKNVARLGSLKRF